MHVVNSGVFTTGRNQHKLPSIFFSMEDHFLFMLDADDPRGLCLADCCDEGRGVALSE